MDKLPNHMLFMKVGLHAGETLDQILARKQAEYDATGMIFWGYGGSNCHPVNQVQPFVRSHIEESPAGIHLVMAPINSVADPQVLPATEYSSDNVNWSPIPKGINVTGSKYALVLEEIQPCELELQMEEFVVGVGPSKGKGANDYLRGRSDKACLSKGVAGAGDKGLKLRSQEIAFAAKLQDPYAVFVRA